MSKNLFCLVNQTITRKHELQTSAATWFHSTAADAGQQRGANLRLHLRVCSTAGEPVTWMRGPAG
ncbi:Uncharacterised protein [Raoultella terrigena]|uniref:Uncharacterized protein n=1 Tax=Raoultella terrigena TaxID=577 RepID=A0A3P8J127_RAOTE|nr:Uncharacterised protein [Raoultella terrigena]